MKLRTLMEEKERFIIYAIPSFTGKYIKRTEPKQREKDLKHKTYTNFMKLLKKLGEKKWDEDGIFDFLYSTQDFIYWDTNSNAKYARDNYNYSMVKEFNPSDKIEDRNNKFKKLTAVKFSTFINGDK